MTTTTTHTPTDNDRVDRLLALCNDLGNAMLNGAAFTRAEMLESVLKDPLIQEWYSFAPRCFGDSFSMALTRLLSYQPEGSTLPFFVACGELKAPTFIHFDHRTTERGEQAIAIMNYYVDRVTADIAARLVWLDQCPRTTEGRLDITLVECEWPDVDDPDYIDEEIGPDGDPYAREYIGCLQDPELMEEINSPFRQAA